MEFTLTAPGGFEPEALAAILADALVLIMTHDHALDLEILARALKRGSFPYLGLIGSARKWLRFRKRLEQRGVTTEQLATVTCPIGVTQGSKTPTAIALSTAAQLSQVLTTRPASSAPTPNAAR